jgi:beta-glucosidase
MIAITAGSPVAVEVTDTNTGDRAGDEIARLHLSFQGVPGAPLRALRAFQRVHLEAGTSQRVSFELELQPRGLSMVTEAGEPIVAEGQYGISVGGGQPNTGARVVTANFNINGKLTLPK